MSDGFTSSTSPRLSPVMPSSVPDCPRNDVLFRFAGTHESWRIAPEFTFAWTSHAAAALAGDAIAFQSRLRTLN